MAEPRRQRPANRPAASAGEAVREPQAGDDQLLCTCCEPRNPLVPRADLGALPDGSAEYALCVLHQPEPVVYRNRGDGVYVRMPRLALSPAGELVDADGNIVAGVAGDGFQRLTTVDDDEPPPPDPGGGSPGTEAHPASRPRTFHVDLTQDDFYRG